MASPKLPYNCEYRPRFNLQHVVSCKKGGFISIRHNQIRNITARLLNEECKDIRVESRLQQITSKALRSSTLTRNEVPLDICGSGFWQAGQMKFFDVRLFNSNTKRYVNQDIPKTYELNKK